MEEEEKREAYDMDDPANQYPKTPKPLGTQTLKPRFIEPLMSYWHQP